MRRRYQLRLHPRVPKHRTYTPPPRVVVVEVPFYGHSKDNKLALIDKLSAAAPDIISEDTRRSFWSYEGMKRLSNIEMSKLLDLITERKPGITVTMDTSYAEQLTRYTFTIPPLCLPLT